MFPQFELFGFIDIHTFGIFAVIAWILFFTLLHVFSIERGLTRHIFTDVVGYTLSILLFSRIFYIISEWRDEKFIFLNLIEWRGIFHFFRELLLWENYDFSLAGGIIGFSVLYFWKSYTSSKHDQKIYRDVVVKSFLISALVGYTWAFLGGQIYGVPFDSWISMIYNDKNSIVPYRSPLFPLPLLYIIGCGAIYLGLSWLREKKDIPDAWFSYMGIGLFGALIFLWEFLNGSSDMFSSSSLHLNLNQLLSIGLITYSLIWLWNMMRS